MKPGEKGWLKEFLRIRQEPLRLLTNEIKKKGSHPEQSLYRIVQPTGLMYGHTIGFTGYPDEVNWTLKERMKILLAESLISSALLFHHQIIETESKAGEIVQQTLENIGQFYNNIFPEIATSAKTLFGKKKAPDEVAETILNKRIEKTVEYEGHFWSYFFHNSLLFLDVFIFGQWIHTNTDKIVADFFRYERDELRFSVVKVMAAASHANKEVVFEERKLLEFFLDSTNLSGEKRKQAIKIFETGVHVEEISIPSENSWILKKFFLEIAILTIWADKRVEEEEMNFLRGLSTQLLFNEDDLENSLIAIEGFVLEHWDELGYLQNKQDYNRVSEQFIARIAKLAERHQGRLLREVQQRPELVELLQKAKGAELSDDDKEEMRLHLISVLRSIPTFLITALPQKFLTLPVLFRMFPKTVLTEGV